MSDENYGVIITQWLCDYTVTAQCLIQNVYPMVSCWNYVIYAVKQSCRFFKIPFFPCYEGFSLNLTAKRIRLSRDFQYCDAYTVIFFLVYLTQHTSSVIFLLHILIHVYYCFPSLFSITPTFPESKVVQAANFDCRICQLPVNTWYTSASDFKCSTRSNFSCEAV